MQFHMLALPFPPEYPRSNHLRLSPLDNRFSDQLSLLLQRLGMHESFKKPGEEFVSFLFHGVPYFIYLPGKYYKENYCLNKLFSNTTMKGFINVYTGNFLVETLDIIAMGCYNTGVPEREHQPEQRNNSGKHEGLT
jgi:hypothetical protein